MKNIMKRKWIAAVLVITMLASSIGVDYLMVHASNQLVLGKSQIFGFSSADELHKGVGAEVSNGKLNIDIATEWGAARARLPYVFEKGTNYSVTFDLDVETSSQPKVWVVLASAADYNAGVDNSDAGMAKRLSTQLNAGTIINAGTGYKYTFDFNASTVRDDLIDQGYKYFGIFVQSETPGDVYIDNVKIGLKGTTIYDFSSAGDLHKGAGTEISNERLKFNIASVWGAARARLPYIFEKDRDYSVTFGLDVAVTSAPKVFVILASDADNNAGVDNSDAGMTKRLSTQLNAGTTITAGAGYTYTFNFNASTVRDDLIDQGYKYFGIFVQSETPGDVYIDNVVIHQHEKVAKAETPEVPQVEASTQNSVTLVAYEGYEYRVGEEGEWQRSNVFEGLQAGVEYKFYQRVAATETVMASDASAAFTFTIQKSYNGQFEFNESDELDYAYVTAGTASVHDGKLEWEQNSGTYQAIRARFPYVLENGKKYKIEYSYSMTRLTEGTNKPQLEFYYAQNADTWEVVKNGTAGHSIYAVDSGQWVNGLTRTGEFIFTANTPTTDFKYLGIFAQPAYAGTLSIDYIRITGANTQEAPSAPQVAASTQNSATLVYHEGYEYRLGADGQWQKSNVFEGLQPGVEYKFYQRKAATDTLLASDASAALTFTIKNNYNGQFEFNESGELDYVTAGAGTTSVQDGKFVWEQTNSSDTWKSIKARLPYAFENGKIYKIEYSYSMTRLTEGTNKPQLEFYYAQNADTWEVVKNGTAGHSIYAVDSGQWVDGSTRTGKYTFTANIPENGYEYMGIFAQPAYAGVLSIDYIRITEINKHETPAAPQIAASTQNSVTLVSHEGYEYRLGADGQWQSSNVFEGLQPGIEYKFYQRVAATDSLLASDASAALTFTIKNNYNGQFEFNESGELDYVTAGSETVDVKDSKLVWEHTNTGEYSQAMKVRLPYAFENGKIYKIEYSYSMTRLTEGTNKPQLAFYYAKDVDDWNVVKNGTAGHSIYAVDSGQWVDGSTRTGKYIFTANIPENGYEYLGIFAQPAYAGTLSIDYIRITEMSTQATPEAPVIVSQTQNSITLKATEGYEYRMNNGEWQTSPVFKGLFVNTTYVFEQRAAETATCLTSETSPASEYVIVLNGDSNADKTITTLDLTVLKEFLVEKITAAMCNSYGCDSNDDSVIDIRDVVNLKKKLTNSNMYYQPATTLSEGYYPVFIDNFDGTELDSNNWTTVPHKAGLTFDDGHEVYMGYHAQHDLLEVKDGILTLKMAKDTSGGTVKYHGSEIRAVNKNDFSYGYVEMRAKLAQGTELWNSFWLTETTRNPVLSEIDIFETLGIGYLKPNMHLWWDVGAEGLPNHLDETGHKNFNLMQLWDNQINFHTYGLEWTEDSLTWYIDGVQKYKVSLGDEVYEEFRKGDPLYLILSLSTGRDDSYISDETLQKTMEVDYIRIYQK